MRILIAEDEPQVREMMRMMVEAETSAEVIEAEDGAQALAILRRDPTIALVICDYRMPKANGGEVFRFILEQGLKTEFILCSAESASVDPVFAQGRLRGVIEKPFIFEGLEKLLSEFKSIASPRTPRPIAPASPPSEEVTELETDFCRVSTALLLALGLIPQDLYMKLADDKYVRVFREGDAFDQADLSRFGEKKVDYLWVPRASCATLFRSLVQSLESVAAVKEVPPEKALRLSARYLDLIHQLFPKQAGSPELEAAIQTSIQLSLATLKLNPGLGPVLHRLRLEPEGFLASHSVALAHVAGELAGLMGWGSELTLHKLSLAALVHDFALENDEVARFRSIDEFLMRRVNASQQELDAFPEHPRQAAAMLRKMRAVPADVDLIVSQHHERPDGLGFPAGIGADRISPLSAVMIVAHEIVSSWLGPDSSRKGEFDLTAFLNQLNERFRQGAFKPILAALVKSLSSFAKA